MKTKAVSSIVACLGMGLSAFFGSITLQCLQLWMAFIIPRTWRWYIDITMYMWISNTVWLMEWLMGIRFRLFGDAIDENDRAIFIMNHRTRLDWLYFYGILMRYGWSVCDEKIVLKHELKRIPGPGWAMQCANYVFLHRDLQRDKFCMSNTLEYLCSVGHKTKILIFPEGTDLNPSSLERSNQFAAKNGLQNYKHVLHPRTAGFVHLVQEAVRHSKANGERLDAVYDVTVAYPDRKFATNELGFLMGRSSSEVHFSCRRYSLVDVLGTDDDDLHRDDAATLRDFVTRSWHEKEAVLTSYYSGDVHTTFLGPEQCLGPATVSQWLGVTIITGNMIVCAVCLILIPAVFVPIFLFFIGVFVYIDFFHCGVDDLVIRLALNDKCRALRCAGGSGDGDGGSTPTTKRG